MQWERLRLERAKGKASGWDDTPTRIQPDLTMGEKEPKRGAQFLPARCAPKPAPLDSDEHYPRLAMVQIGDVAVPIRDGRAVRPKTNENAKIKIRAVPARPRSVPAAPRQPDPEDAPEVQVETEGTSDDPINLETPVKKVERQECTVEDMFPPLSPVQSPRRLAIAEDIIANRQVDVLMDEEEPNWAAEIARLDRQWEARFAALQEQWGQRLVNLNRDWGFQFSKLDR